MVTEAVSLSDYKYCDYYDCNNMVLRKVITRKIFLSGEVCGDSRKIEKERDYNKRFMLQKETLHCYFKSHRRLASYLYYNIQSLKHIAYTYSKFEE
jgi:hypothetical protein